MPKRLVSSQSETFITQLKRHRIFAEIENRILAYFPMNPISSICEKTASGFPDKAANMSAR